jgi:hypothetical protein
MGAFPTPESAMENAYYRESMSIALVEDPEAATTAEEMDMERCWMVKSNRIPRSWMKRVKAILPQHTFRGNAGNYIYWEWVSQLIF